MLYMHESAAVIDWPAAATTRDISPLVGQCHMVESHPSQSQTCGEMGPSGKAHKSKTMVCVCVCVNMTCYHICACRLIRETLKRWMATF
jgi:hypothetical protein